MMDIGIMLVMLQDAIEEDQGSPMHHSIGALDMITMAGTER